MTAPSSDTAEAGTDAPDGGPLTHSEIKKILRGMMLAISLGALDQTVVATAMPTIGRSFGDFENLSWVVTAYLLTATAATPLYGKLSDIHGRRAMMLIAICIFLCGSLACALAPTMTALILGRALQGLGGGGLMSLVQTILADVASPRERGRYQGYLSVVFGIASVGGPLLGGVLTQHLHWSLIFWINLPLGLAGFLMVNNTLKRLPRHDRPHKLDVLGAFLMIAAAIALLFALNWGGNRYPWTSATILSLLGCSATLWGLFVMRLLTTPEPFLPLAILANPIARYATLSNACSFSAVIGLTIFVPIYCDTVLHLSASQAGLALIPMMLTMVLSSTAAGQFVMHMTHYKRIPIVGTIVAIANLLILATWSAPLSVTGVALMVGIAGLGFGFTLPVCSVSMQNAVAPYQMGVATGTLAFCRQLTSAMVVAALGAILLAGLGADGGSAVALARNVSRGIDLAPAFRWIFAALAVLVTLSLCFILLMEERPLRGPTKSPAPVPAE